MNPSWIHLGRLFQTRLYPSAACRTGRACHDQSAYNGTPGMNRFAIPCSLRGS